MALHLKKLKSVKGVSLIELMLAMAIFSVLILAATGIFKMVVDGQRNSLSAQNVQENIRYAMEKMSKEMRMAGISNEDCEAMFSPRPTAVYKIFNTTADAGKLYFKNQYGDCVAYYLEGGRLKIMLDQGGSSVSGFITPAKVTVSGLKFFVDDDEIGEFHSKQPYVTMKMKIIASGQGMSKQEMDVQLTVSSRYYE